MENKLYTIPTTNIALSSNVNLYRGTKWSSASANGFLYGRSQAIGDWTGFKWYNKFKNTTGVRTITGATSFNVYPSGGKFKAAKINEWFDPSSTINSYRLQDKLTHYDTFFDTFLGTIVEGSSGNPAGLGKQIYEKIANFTDNIADIDTCNIPALYSICQMHDIDIHNYNFDYPGGLKRVMDLTSVPHGKLWGARSKFNRDLAKFNTHTPKSGCKYGH